MFKTGTLARIKLNTKDLLPTIDLCSSNTEGPSALEQDPVVQGMSKHGTQTKFLLPACTEITIIQLTTGIAHINKHIPIH